MTPELYAKAKDDTQPMHPALRRDLLRWYPLKPHPEQLRLINSPALVKLVPAGRRSGKTERGKRHLVKRALMDEGNYFAAAPTYNQAKRIFWNDLKQLSLSSTHKRRPSESELTIFLPNGSTISVFGLDAPERIEGSPWSGGLVDEFGNLIERAWPENIQPALSTVDPRRPDFRAWVWLLGVPEGLNHYYKMVQGARARNDPQHEDVFTWHSADILPADVIANARRNLSPRQFRQEYEAAFEGANGRIYEDYGPMNHCFETLQPEEPIIWCHDFNYSPLSSAVIVKRGEKLYAVDEFVIYSAVAANAADEFIERYKGHKCRRVYLYGDPAGKAGEKHGQESNYSEIEKRLRSAGWNVERRVEAAAPAIRDRQNAVRAMIYSASGERRFFVNPLRCPVLDDGLSTVQVKKGSAFLETETDSQHITTAIGYMIARDYPVDDRLTAVDFVRIS